MSDQDLTVEAQAWRRGATALLDASGLTRILGNHGRLVLSRAYAYDTMTSPDIDLHLIPDVFSRHKAVEILNGLIGQDWWNTFTLGDWMQDRFRAAAEGSVTRGYFLRLAGFFRGGPLERRRLAARSGEVPGRHMGPPPRHPLAGHLRPRRPAVGRSPTAAAR